MSEEGTKKNAIRTRKPTSAVAKPLCC
jgi:hypothetical protein